MKLMLCCAHAAAGLMLMLLVLGTHDVSCATLSSPLKPRSQPTGQATVGIRSPGPGCFCLLDSRGCAPFTRLYPFLYIKK